MLSEKTDEQILEEIEVHSSNAVKLLKRSHEIHLSAINLDNLDAYLSVIKRAVSFQKLAMDEMSKMISLQKMLSEK